MPNPVITSRASHHPVGDERFNVQLLVRVTPELHELIHQGAAEEDRRVAEFVRDAVIHRLDQLGLVPHVDEDAEP
jgi:predicted HicB family RNase H-like nuclease